MYKKLVPLDKENHKTLKLNQLDNLNFAKDTAFAPVLLSEIANISLTFPIVFTDDENPIMTMLMSLGTGNLALNEDGKWITRYIPSFIRKYPFEIVSKKDEPEQKIILIDEEAKVFSKTKGKQLFKKNGNHSETLEKAINYLQFYSNEFEKMKAFAREISKSGILETTQISVGEEENKKILVQGFKIINKEKLYSLDDEILASWVRSGIISLIDIHLKSLNNIQTLFNLANKTNQNN